MGFTVSSLSEYINQENTNLIPRLFYPGRTAQYFNMQTGIKHKEALQLLDVTAFPQVNSCSPSSSGGATYTQRTITVGDILYRSDFCPKDLKSKWTQKLLARAARPEMEQRPWEADIVESIMGTVTEQQEKCIWQGDTSSGDPVLSKYDGLIKIIDAAGTATDGNTSSATAITGGSSGNADDLVFDMCDARPAALRTATDVVLFCPTDVFNKVIDATIKKNNYHIDATSYANYTWQIPGRNATLVGVHGLDGTNRMFLGRTSNFFIGVDGMNDEERFESWYSKDDRKVYWEIEFKMGTQIARPAEIVEFTLS